SRVISPPGRGKGFPCSRPGKGSGKRSSNSRPEPTSIDSWSTGNGATTPMRRSGCPISMEVRTACSKCPRLGGFRKAVVVEVDPMANLPRRFRGSLGALLGVKKNPPGSAAPEPEKGSGGSPPASSLAVPDAKAAQGDKPGEPPAR